MRAIIRIRWDLPWYDADGNDRFPERKTKEWQAERLRLFETYTLPSLRAQTHEDWIACLQIDPDVTFDTFAFSAEDLDRRVRAVMSRDDEATAGYGAERRAFVMRLDSDDMISPSTIEKLIANARKDRFVMLNDAIAWSEREQAFRSWINPAPPCYGKIVEGPIDFSIFGHHVENGRNAVRVDSHEDQPAILGVVLHKNNISNAADGPWSSMVLAPGAQALWKSVFPCVAKEASKR